MKIYVHYRSICTHSEREEKEFGSWSEDIDFSIAGVSTRESRQYSNEQFDVDFDAVPGDTVFVLYMTYSTGDSFGSSSGNGEIIWVFSDRLVAQEALLRWQHACDVHNTDWHSDNKQQFCSFRVDGGRYIKLNNVVFGYFERLSSLELVPMTLE
jgi:hypothetical protein